MATNPDDLIGARLHSLDTIELLRLGKTSVTLGGLIAGLVIIAAAVAAAKLTSHLLCRLRNRSGQAASSIYIFEQLAKYALIFLGVIAGFSTIGLDLSSLALFAGALGVGLGFGLQGVVKEFISGLVLLFDREIKIGDYVELQTGERGLVEEIGPRATRVRNSDDLNVLIPNSRLIEAPVINWTHDSKTRRIHIPFRVAYGVDKERVRDLVLEGARGVPFTLADTDRRKSQVWLVGFGESGLNFELVVWPSLEAVRRPNAAHAAYTWAIEDALRRGGIEIPYAQTDLRIRTLFGEEGADAFVAAGLQGRPKPARPKTKPPPTTNDAVDDLMRGAVEDAENPKLQPEPRRPD
jgi:small-conductance mechanosensitive channel